MLIHESRFLVALYILSFTCLSFEDFNLPLKKLFLVKYIVFPSILIVAVDS